mmetsp:Transcript_30338/g.91839  ORF Transcript_30338/g.91839 Transcript_30338/m.91839 type:complete len:329 (-) Transcript_30338:3-989(-)
MDPAIGRDWRRRPSASAPRLARPTFAAAAVVRAGTAGHGPNRRNRRANPSRAGGRRLQTAPGELGRQAPAPIPAGGWAAQGRTVAHPWRKTLQRGQCRCRPANRQPSRAALCQAAPSRVAPRRAAPRRGAARAARSGNAATAPSASPDGRAGSGPAAAETGRPAVVKRWAAGAPVNAATKAADAFDVALAAARSAGPWHRPARLMWWARKWQLVGQGTGHPWAPLATPATTRRLAQARRSCLRRTSRTCPRKSASAWLSCWAERDRPPLVSCRRSQHGFRPCAQRGPCRWHRGSQHISKATARGSENMATKATAPSGPTLSASHSGVA